MDVLASFYTLLYSHRVSREGEDKLWWAPSRKAKFNTSSFYKILTCKDAPPFPWKSIWRTKASFKVAFFIWSMAQGKILTMDNLRDILLCLCKLNREPSTIFSSIVRSSVPYGTFFSVSPVCLWLCPIKWRTCLTVGGREVALKVPSCGRWHLFASCGTFGGKEMIKTSRIKKRLWRSSIPFSFILSFLVQLLF